MQTFLSKWHKLTYLGSIFWKKKRIIMEAKRTYIIFFCYFSERCMSPANLWKLNEVTHVYKKLFMRFAKYVRHLQ